MNNHIANKTIETRLISIQQLWQSYLVQGQQEQFIDFIVAVNSLTEQFNAMRTAGLVRLCETLENHALTKIGENISHPIPQDEITQIQEQLNQILSAVSGLFQSLTNQRNASTAEFEEVWFKPRTIWLVAPDENNQVLAGLRQQLTFFGFKVFYYDWEQKDHSTENPLAILFLPASKSASAGELKLIKLLRFENPSSQLVYLDEHTSIEPIVELMRCGIDTVIPYRDKPAMVLSFVLDLVQFAEQQKSKVLIVEDSRVAVALIERTLHEHGIDTHAIQDPSTLLQVLESYQPDLILMDMYMPRFNGVEATRVIRQMPAYSAIPIVYLSGESEVSMQVEALRLGGDQFLIKPVNPVLLAAVVKTKVERHRESRRTSHIDGLTGLLNHTAAKSRLKSFVNQIDKHRTLTVAMIDIDRFKSINDNYGHPVGDQVIRSLSWLLKGHLRSSDLIGRYGGEEFIVGLPGVSAEQTQIVIDRIRNDFANLAHCHANGLLNATFSAGIAEFTIDDNAENITEAADQALLNAKRNGRNRIEQSVRKMMKEES